jgi:ABC-type transport system involved in resistance to organic solvents, auxiliary component
MNLKSKSVQLLSLLCILITPLAAKHEKSEAHLERYVDLIEQLGNTVIHILKDRQQTLPVRKERFRKVVLEHFAMPTIGQFVAGRYWRQMTAEQKTTFLTLFEEAVIENYARQFDSYSNEQLVVKSAHLTNDTPPGVLVKSLMTRQGDGTPLPLVWKVYNTKRGLKVTDVIVDNVSMGLSLRNEYASAVENRGGIEGLFDYLREKIHHDHARKP